jgi:hypothetical protein
VPSSFMFVKPSVSRHVVGTPHREPAGVVDDGGRRHGRGHEQLRWNRSGRFQRDRQARRRKHRSGSGTSRGDDAVQLLVVSDRLADLKEHREGLVPRTRGDVDEAQRRATAVEPTLLLPDEAIVLERPDPAVRAGAREAEPSEKRRRFGRRWHCHHVRAGRRPEVPELQEVGSSVDLGALAPMQVLMFTAG